MSNKKEDGLGRTQYAKKQEAYLLRLIYTMGFVLCDLMYKTELYHLNGSTTRCAWPTTCLNF